MRYGYNTIAGTVKFKELKYFRALAAPLHMILKLLGQLTAGAAPDQLSEADLLEFLARENRTRAELGANA